ncbi:hypothetical protein ZOSMA_52G00850 [Zostera marina]|uniref:RING-type domain-containing protein n=1 Tax=Zostera marina TaxID=29655 RepID=A0A0K9NZP5_ZOSMR|nr:hypothetical protein ZOSMA_52G00850 [Zostera marina]
MSPAAFLFYSRREDRNRIDSNSSRILRCDLFPIRKITFDSADQHPPLQEEPHRAASGHYRGNSASSSFQGSEIRNNPLPSSVLQARARLVERLYLNGGTRQRSRTSCISWVTDSHRQPRRSRTVSFNSIQEESNLSKNNKPPGLDHNSVNALSGYVFRDDEIDSGLSSHECSICLEKFKHGDTLMILPSCIHKFHHVCLEPWITNHGDCPYCRTTITRRK